MFETRPYIHCYGTTTAKMNAPPQSGRGRFQTCPELRQALNLPFPDRSSFSSTWRYS